MLFRVFRYECNAIDSLAAQLGNHAFDRKITIDGLATRHRHRVVIQYLVGNVDTRGDCFDEWLTDRNGNRCHRPDSGTRDGYW